MLTLWRRNYFFNFSTPCIQNMNNTGTKQVSIMKQTAFWREKTGEYRACLKFSVPVFVEQIYKMQRLEVSGAVRPIYGSLGVKRLICTFFLSQWPILPSPKIVTFPPELPCIHYFWNGCTISSCGSRLVGYGQRSRNLTFMPGRKLSQYLLLLCVTSP